MLPADSGIRILLTILNWTAEICSAITQQLSKLEANMHKQMSLKSFNVSKVKPTGNIMIQAGGDTGECIFFVPSATGGFVGERFYSHSPKSWKIKANYGFRISALEDTKVKTWNLELKRMTQEFEVKQETISASNLKRTATRR